MNLSIQVHSITIFCFPLENIPEFSTRFASKVRRKPIGITPEYYGLSTEFLQNFGGILVEFCQKSRGIPPKKLENVSKLLVYYRVKFRGYQVKYRWNSGIWTWNFELTKWSILTPQPRIHITYKDIIRPFSNINV